MLHTIQCIIYIISKLRPNTSQAVPEGKIFQAIPETEGRIFQAVPLFEGLPVKSFPLRIKRMLLFPSEVRVAWVFLGISLGLRPREIPRKILTVPPSDGENISYYVVVQVKQRKLSLETVLFMIV